MSRPTRVSCVMPTTSSRRWCLPLAVRQFLRQTVHEGGPRTELLVVFDGPGSVHDLLPRDSRIRLVEIPEGGSLGAKFNACVAHAAGEVIALWADDDWHHRERVARSVDLLRACDVPIVGSLDALFHELHAPNNTYEYQSPDGSLVGGTCTFTREIARRVPFPDRPSGVDTMWLCALQKAGVPMTTGDLPPYIAFQHGQTTGRKQWPPTGSCWTGPLHGADLTEILGDDLSAYRRAYARWSVDGKSA